MISNVKAGIGKRHDKTTEIAVNAIVLMYVILKLAFYMFFVEGNYWIVRLISGILTVILIIPINSNPRVSRRIMAIYAPFMLALIESFVCIAVDGDRLYFMFLVGSAAMSLIYVDYIGLLIHTCLISIVSGSLVFIFRFNMLGEGYDLSDATMQFFGFTICNIILYVICTFSVGQYKRYESTSKTFMTIMDTTPSYMIIINDKTKVEYISDSLVKWLNLEESRYANDRPVLDLFASGDMKMMFHEVMENTGFVEKNFEITIDEKKYWFTLRSSTMGGNKGARFFEWIDITQVMDAKNEAEIAAKAKSDFLAKMSHEIRTPMNAITGMSELILREDISPVICEHAISIKHAGANLVSIINDILDISKIESGKLEITNTEYLFASLINDVLSIIRMRILEKQILFVVNTDCNIPNSLIGDEVRIRQILLNLLGNAVKYTNEGFISITIKSSAVADNTVYLTIEISDSGIGIKDEDIGKLFDDFVQIDKEKNKGVEGTGLGLAIAKNLCVAMGGDISAHSEYNVGSTFTITLPQKLNKYEKFACVKNPEEKHVLIYEPRTVYADSVAWSINNLGVQYTLAANQSEFFESLKKFSYPFVFVSSFLLESVKGMLESLGIDAKLVLLTEFSEVIVSENVRMIAMPAHSISIANVLNDVEDDISYNERTELDLRFTAPSARILIVDDITTNIRVAEGLMSPYKMQIDTCTSGREAVELIKANRYDVIFMDHMMPEMDGIEAAGVIRGLDSEDDYHKNVPIIALTANAVSGIKEMFLQNGLDDFLAKPIEISKLNSILEKWIPCDKRVKYEGAKTVSARATFEIDGVDVNTGIAMTGGTIENYLKTLNVFYKDGLKKIGEIRECVEINNITLYTIHVHALKSAAASIGAAQISDFAKTLEIAGKNESTAFIRENTEEFLDSLEALLKGINAVLTSNQANQTEVQATKNDIEFLCNEIGKLKEALDKMDIRGIDDILSSIKLKNWNKKINDMIDDISESILLFDYDEALELTEELLSIATLDPPTEI